MRAKLLVTDPNGRYEFFLPKTLDCFLARKRTAQTGFVIAARSESGGGVTLWFAGKWWGRILEEFDLVFEDGDFTLSQNSWRTCASVHGGSKWGLFKAECTERRYVMTPVRSFRRFTR